MTETMTDIQAKPISITGMACRFPEAGSLSALCQLAFSESKQTQRKIDDQFFAPANTIVHPSDLLVQTLLDAVKDANLSAEDLTKSTILVFGDRQQLIDTAALTSRLKLSLKQTFDVDAINIRYLTDKEINSLAIFINTGKEYASFGAPAILLSLGSNEQSSPTNGYGIAALVLEQGTKEETRIYAHLSEAHFVYSEDSASVSVENKKSQLITPLAIGLVVCSNTSIFDSSSRTKISLENTFRAAFEDAGYLHPLLPWSALNATENLVGNYGAATALASIITASLALYLKILPSVGDPGNHEEALAQDTCFYRSPLARPWIEAKAPGKLARKSIVLSDADYIFLEESSGEPDLSLIRNWSSELFAFQAESAEALQQQLETFLHAVYAHPKANLFELAFSLNSLLPAKKEQTRLAIVAHSVAELKERLSQASILVKEQSLNRFTDSQPLPAGIYYSPQLKTEPDKLAFILPGLGAAYPDMLIDLCFQFPEIREVFDFGDWLAVQGKSTSLPSQKIFPVKFNNPWGTASQSSLASMDSAVVTVVLAEWSIYVLLQHFGISPDSLMGCSTGEFAALLMNGSINIFDAHETFYKMTTTVSRSVAPEQLINLRSLRIKISRSAVEKLLSKLSAPSYLGAELTADDVIVSGPRKSIEELSKLLRADKVEFYPLPSSIPYHTPLVAGKVSNKQHEITNLPIRKPYRESWSCSTGAKYPEDPDAIRKISTDLFEKPILFRSTLESMYECGSRIFLEAGPKGGLVPLISEILKAKEHTALAFNQLGRTGLEQLQQVLSLLYCNGFHINFDHLYKRRREGITALNLEYTKPQEFTGQMTENLDQYAAVSNYMKSMFDLYQDLVKSQENLLLSYLKADADASASASASASAKESIATLELAFLKASAIEKKENSLTAICRLSTSEHQFLLDHAIGGIVSKTSDERVYLVPLMVTLEIMAEAAAYLVPNHFITAIKDIRAYKRIRVDNSTKELVVQAQTDPAQPASVSVKVTDAESGQICTSCKIDLGQEYPAAPPQKSDSIKNKIEPSLEKLYGKGSMFHGKRLQSVEKLLWLSPKNNQANIRHSQPTNWFADGARNQLIAPLLLDNASQLIFYHLLEHKHPAIALLPFHIDRIDFFGNPEPTHELLRGQTNMHSMTNRGSEAEVEIFREHEQKERMLLKITNISSRAIILPDAWCQFIDQPQEKKLANRLLLKNAGQNTVTIIGIQELPEDETAIDWCTDYLLHPNERGIWQSLETRSKRRIEWLLGRIAAKDAVRILIEEHFGLALFPADIEIIRSTDGQPQAVGKWLSDIELVPQIAISHSAGTAVAVASNGNLSPGIDIEEIRERDQGFAEIAFTRKELGYLERWQGAERARWETVLWTAKEAVAKALGTGLKGNPQHFEMDEIDPETGRLFIKLCSPDQINEPEERFLVSTEQFGNMALSLTLSKWG